MRGATTTGNPAAKDTEFQPTRPLRGATRKAETGHRRNEFQPTRPLRGATVKSVLVAGLGFISTHAPLAGRDRPLSLIPLFSSTFQPTRPLRGATHHLVKHNRLQKFQPTRPLRGATTCHGRSRRTNIEFQPTRPLRGATPLSLIPLFSSTFQPTRPLRGATQVSSFIPEPIGFQPTRPLRGATAARAGSLWTTSHFNPRAPCGARRSTFGHWEMDSVISTHAPLAGRDRKPRRPLLRPLLFQPTRPLRGATRAGAQRRRPYSNFNPRAPCGARQQKSTNHYAHFCDNRQISDAFAQNAACQGILLLFDAGKPCGFWVRTAQVISAHLCFAL